MVPLMDGVGQVIGFTGRIVDDSQASSQNAPKYLNTPQTILYDKGRHVFGLSQAKEAIRANDYSVIVEGNLDVVSSHQVGITQVIATAGTAMTESHLRALVRLSEHARLAFDGDKAGIAATERAIPIAQVIGVNLSIVSMPDGAKDPDELIQKDPALWQKAINDAQPAVDWVFKQYALRSDLTTAAGKREFTTAALMLVKSLRDEVEKEHYVLKVAAYTGSSITVLNNKLAAVGTTIITQPLKKVVHHNESNNFDMSGYQDNLLALGLTDSATHDLFRQAEADLFVGEERQAVVKFLLSNGGKSVKDTPEQLQKYDTYVKILLLKADARYADWNDQDRYFETARLLRQVTTEYKKKQKDILIEQLRDAENLGDDTKADSVRGKLNELIKEIQSGQR